MSDGDVTPFGQTGMAATLTAQGATARAAPSSGDAMPMGTARYELGAEIGRGGMGLVHSAID
jgi:hypothetical protein